MGRLTLTLIQGGVTFGSIVECTHILCQIEHSRHRSIFNFLVNLMAGLAAYTYLPQKPSLDIYPKDLPALPPAVF